MSNRYCAINHCQARNFTHTDPRELYTGLTDISKKGLMVSWSEKKVPVAKFPFLTNFHATGMPKNRCSTTGRRTSAIPWRA